MKISHLVVAISMAVSLPAIAGEEAVTYSTEGYCTLAKAGVTEGHMKAYAKKLGMTPSKKVCKSFNDYVSSVQPKEWDYRGGKLYPGSTIRLSPTQVEKLRAAKGMKK